MQVKRYEFVAYEAHFWSILQQELSLSNISFPLILPIECADCPTL